MLGSVVQIHLSPPNVVKKAPIVGAFSLYIHDVALTKFKMLVIHWLRFITPPESVKSSTVLILDELREIEEWSKITDRFLFLGSSNWESRIALPKLSNPE
jgi:hypothetical protein